MSYDLHIIKAEHWVYSRSNPITPDDVKQVAAVFHAYDIPFLYREGRITVCGADDTLVRFMLEVSKRLGAHVQGDDGEYYNNDDNQISLIPEHIWEQDIIIEPEPEISEEDKWIELLGIHDEINHLKFGVGQILEILGEGTDKEFLVRFSNGDKVKRILPYYSSIQPIS